MPWELDGTLIDQLPAGIYACRAPAGEIVRYNRRAAAIWGREPLLEAGERYCGAHRAFDRGGAPLSPTGGPVARVLATGAAERGVQVVYERPDGSRVSARLSVEPLRDAAGAVIGAVAMLEGAEVCPRAPPSPLEELLDVCPVPAYLCDAEGLITYFNRPAQDLWGRAPLRNDARDRYCGSYRLFSTDGGAIPHDHCWMAVALQTGVEQREKEIVIERPDGRRLSALAHATPLRAPDGALLGAVNVLLDLTERKRAAEVLKDDGRRKEEFLAMLAHELRNPLAPLATGIELLGLAGDDPAMVSEVRLTMKRQVDQLVRLVEDLLEVSRITSGRIALRPQPLELDGILEEALEVVRVEAAERRQGLTAEICAAPLRLEGDAARLRQAFSNLLINAVRYTPPGGWIHLEASAAGREAVVRIRDSGKGLAPEMLERIFDPFEQGRGERAGGNGLGVGLTLVHSLIQLHGGSVSAHSAGLGQGSEFVVRLPLAEPRAAAEHPRAPAAGETALPRLRILVVDDNEDAARSLALLLSTFGLEVCVAVDGGGALAELKRFGPDVAFLDIGLPDMSGYDIARSVRAGETACSPTLVALTGWGQDHDVRRAFEAGFDHHVVKPASLERLRSILAGLSPRATPRG